MKKHSWQNTKDFLCHAIPAINTYGKIRFVILTKIASMAKMREIVLNVSNKYTVITNLSISILALAFLLALDYDIFKILLEILSLAVFSQG